MSAQNISFSITSDVTALGIKCAVFSISNLSNQLKHPKFEEYKTKIYNDLKSNYSKTFLSQDPTLLGFEISHKKIGSSNQKLIASPQSLISILLRKGSLPCINLLVDIYNCISIESRLSLGAHDIDKLQNNVTLRIADGTEKFIPLGKSKAEKVSAGEYCYIDGNDTVICRLECRQADATKISLNTKNALVIVQGNENTSGEYINGVMKRLIDLITSYCGGSATILWQP